MHRRNVHAFLQPGPGRRIAAASAATIVFLALAGGLTIWTRSAVNASYSSASIQSAAARRSESAALALARIGATAYAIRTPAGPARLVREDGELDAAVAALPATNAAERSLVATIRARLLLFDAALTTLESSPSQRVPIASDIDKPLTALVARFEARAGAEAAHLAAQARLGLWGGGALFGIAFAAALLLVGYAAGVVRRIGRGLRAVSLRLNGAVYDLRIASKEGRQCDGRAVGCGGADDGDDRTARCDRIRDRGELAARLRRRCPNARHDAGDARGGRSDR